MIYKDNIFQHYLNPPFYPPFCFIIFLHLTKIDLCLSKLIIKRMLMVAVIDFFCGCGGTSAGLKAAGMEILAGIDIDPSSMATFKENFKGAKAIEHDIEQLSPDFLLEEIGALKHPLLVSACAPCQPFSQQNKTTTDDDERRELLDHMHKFIEAYEPEYILLENVPGIQRIKEGPLTRFQDFLTDQGYRFDVDVKSTHHYGVPQKRKRLVLIASKNSDIQLPTPTHGTQETLKPYVTVWDVIKKYPEIPHGHNEGSIPNHQTAKISEKNLIRLKHTPEGGDWRDWPDELLLNCHRKLKEDDKAKGYTDTYGRLMKDAPAITLTTKCTSISNGRFGHPLQDRALSVREAAALQSFKDDFVFVGTLGQTAKQVGNAVPVKFAEALGEQIIRHYQGV